jgi:hypothetical protein
MANVPKYFNFLKDMFNSRDLFAGNFTSLRVCFVASNAPRNKQIHLVARLPAEVTPFQKSDSKYVDIDGWRGRFLETLFRLHCLRPDHIDYAFIRQAHYKSECHMEKIGSCQEAQKNRGTACNECTAMISTAKAVCVCLCFADVCLVWLRCNRF